MKEPRLTDQPDDAANPEEELLDEGDGRRFLFFQVMPSWLTSFLVHIILIIVLAIAAWRIPGKTLVSLESGEATTDVTAFENLDFNMDESSEMLEQNSEVENTNEEELIETVEYTEIEEEYEEEMPSLMEPTENFGMVEEEASAPIGAMPGGSGQISGRSQSERMKHVRQNGGNAASENAVKLALDWLAEHQLANGSWNFDHRLAPGTILSPNPGDFNEAPNAATSMALLCFLGAGQTHIEGDYKEVVENGLAFLLNNGVRTRNGLTFEEDQGGLYNHGLAAIALCETYAMTDDIRFAQPAQEALRYIEWSQDPIGGGWRYEPKQAGDTSAVGWQIMALKSAHMCGLEVDSAVIRMARRFLNFVSSESGTFYGYTHPVEERRKGVTSVGLLSQMYLGWTKDNPALTAGVKWIGERGPHVGDWKPDMMSLSEAEKPRFRCGMYYNYYATQLMRQYGGEKWDKWNLEMRDFLIATQATEGAAKGSWFFQDPDEGGYIHGGRLYATTLACMTLEVYYRYLPLYDDEKTSEAEFELD
ncbi:MAG: prenyltransferase/squalene oxidase repeat-containing protein [Pirellulaceae bacterium]